MSTSPVAVASRPPSPPRCQFRNLSPPDASFFKLLADLRQHAQRSAASSNPNARSSPDRPILPWPGSDLGPENRDASAPKTPPDPGGDPACEREPAVRDLLDPWTRHFSNNGCVVDPTPRLTDDAPVDRVDRARAVCLEDRFGALVRSAAWSIGADRRSATLRLEIGAGALEGCTILISASPQDLQIVLDSPPGVEVEVWKNRLRQRFASMGLAASFP